MITIRNAEAGDEETLAYIQTESWKAAFAGILRADDLAKYTDLEKTVQMYGRVLQNPAIFVLLESVDEKPHCMAAWGESRTKTGKGNEAELICIHSLPDNWRRGYGSAMMERVLAESAAAGFSDIILWVFEANVRARKFYEKHGFILTGARHENHFGADEVMYAKRLKK